MIFEMILPMLFRQNSLDILQPFPRNQGPRPKWMRDWVFHVPIHLLRSYSPSRYVVSPCPFGRLFFLAW